ncbi:alpha/beta fold hydrolase [Tenggerimyces flavus]|uniref:Alpha/beta fold hydrolase n=1 Tax=Tenggerimyces flavus TaxID=1708749 RepID=A0ABV7YN99_9ACTN|nr:alpha/beta hydrolase [Tenggerimyces flavus]MBM7790403.1 pimeloyl-ACP methyl ester carboxylesterase [Tenggerimyces flavus]
MDKVTSNDGTTIAYERHGAGPALVAVDAAMNGGDHRPLPAPVSQLAEHFTVYVYDRRGRGGSGDTAPYAVEREVEDLAAVIEAAGGSAYVYGMSSGSLLALHAAARRLPITKLALFEPPIEPREELTGESAFTVAMTALVSAGRRREAVEFLLREIGVPADLVASMPPESWAGQEALVHTMLYDCAISDGTTLPMIRSVRVPTLLLASEASGSELGGMAELVAKELPNATFRSVAGKWHGPSPDAMVAALREFFLS